MIRTICRKNYGVYTYVGYPESCRHITGIPSYIRASRNFLDARTFPFASSATVSTCLDLTQEGPARWPVRELVRPV